MVPSLDSLPRYRSFRTFLNALVVGTLLTSFHSTANPGDLDTTFGAGGVVTTSLGTQSDSSASAVAVRPDGKIVVAGCGPNGFAAVRYNADGSLDDSFGSHGVASAALTPLGFDCANALVLQPDGKIVLGGRTYFSFNAPVQTQFALARFNSDGTLDGSFGDGGKVVTAIGSINDQIFSIALQSDGKILAAGYTQSGPTQPSVVQGSETPTNIVVARYSASGQLDSTFGRGGKLVITFGADYPSGAETVLISPNSDIIIVGHITSLDSASYFLDVGALALLRLDTNGAVDLTFGSGLDVKKFQGRGGVAAMQPDGKIVVGGIRFDASGAIDPTFVSEAILFDAIAIQPDGKILLGGTQLSTNGPNQFALQRLDANGANDSTFGLTGTVSTPPASAGSRYGDQLAGIGVQPDGNIVAVGLTNGSDGRDSILLIRYLGGPTSPSVGALNYEGLWWASPPGSESGWGINLAHQGDVIFATWFTYDSAGQAWWLSMTAAKTAANVYQGQLVQTRGPAFSAMPFDPNAVTRSIIGSAALTFNDANNGTFAYTVNGVSHTKAITRELFGAAPTCSFVAQPDYAASTNYQDLWWAAPAGAEAGWGLNLTMQSNVIFATWFTYDVDGTPLWLSTTATAGAAGVYTGQLVRTSGPAFSAAVFDPSKVGRTVVGTATLSFAHGNDATFAYTVGGVSQTKAITREAFASPRTVCQ